jgi:hypothetical protein
VTLACAGGAWQCTFPPGVCNGGGCASTAEICDALDNNCDGRINENVPSYGKPCASDDGLAAPGHGRCRTTGSFVCSGPSQTVCSAVAAACSSLPGGCEEKCDGIDNDCDGLTDEPFTSKGTNSAYFVKPAVTQTSPGLWEYTYDELAGWTELPGYATDTSSAPPDSVRQDRFCARRPPHPLVR